MSNYYYRDKEGNWFISSNRILVPFEYSSSMEIAYQMGKIAALDELREAMNENLMQIRDSYLVKDVRDSKIGGCFE